MLHTDYLFLKHFPIRHYLTLFIKNEPVLFFNRLQRKRTKGATFISVMCGVVYMCICFGVR